jgi:hypothetical protein
MKRVSTEEFAAFIGLDWVEAKHAICLQATGSAHREFLHLDHRPDAIDAWVQSLRTRFNGQPMAVCLELNTGPIVAALRQYEFLVLFPVNPLTVAKYREAFTPSRAKDDPTDAELQVELLLKHRDKLTPLSPQSPTMRALAQLVEHRRRLVGDKVRITNRLTSALKNYFPHVLQWFQEKDTAIFCDFLSRWPTLKAAQLARRTTLEGFFRAHHVRSADVISTRIEATKSARALTTDDGVIIPNVLLVQALVAQLRVTVQAIADFDTTIARHAQDHPDFPLFDALPGAGAVFAPVSSWPLANNGNATPLPRNSKNTRASRRSRNAVARSPGCTGASSVRRSCAKRSWNGPRNRFGIPAGPRSTPSSNATRARRTRRPCAALDFKWIRILYRR